MGTFLHFRTETDKGLDGDGVVQLQGRDLSEPGRGGGKVGRLKADGATQTSKKSKRVGI